MLKYLKLHVVLLRGVFLSQVWIHHAGAAQHFEESQPVRPADLSQACECDSNRQLQVSEAQTPHDDPAVLKRKIMELEEMLGHYKVLAQTTFAKVDEQTARYETIIRIKSHIIGELSKDNKRLEGENDYLRALAGGAGSFYGGDEYEGEAKDIACGHWASGHPQTGQDENLTELNKS